MDGAQRAAEKEDDWSFVCGAGLHVLEEDVSGCVQEVTVKRIGRYSL
jgi:hypothetical protein